MYDIKKITGQYRTSPWNRPIEDKIKLLKTAKRLKKRTVVFLYPSFDSSTFRYRGYNVADTLDYSLQWTGIYFEGKEIPYILQEVENIDILVAIRCTWDFETEELIQKARACGAKIVYDVDDLIYHPKYMPIVIRTLGLRKGEEAWDDWFGRTQQHREIADICDAYITTNGYLAEYLESDYSKSCYIIKNYLNEIQEKVSEELFLQKQDMQADKPFIIGYFSGSPTHVKDLMIAMPEVEQFLNNHDDAKLRIVGYMDLPEQYNYLVKLGKIEYVSFKTFVGLQVEQAKVDVNIVPLVNNEFSNCKSELKYFETAIVGTITCATPTYTYSRAIVNGDNGYLCEQGEWLSALEKIYAEGVSLEKQKYICQKALDEYGSRNQLEHIENVFNSIFDDK